MLSIRQPLRFCVQRRALSVSRRSFSADDSSRPFPSPHPTRPIQNAPPSKPQPPSQDFQLPSSLAEIQQPPDTTSRAASGNGSNNSNFKVEAATTSSNPTPVEHLFDTYKLLQVLENQGFTRAQAEIVMKGIKFRLRDRWSGEKRDGRLRTGLLKPQGVSSAYIQKLLLQRSDLDNVSPNNTLTATNVKQCRLY